MSRTYYHRHTRKPWKWCASVRRVRVHKPRRAQFRAWAKKAVQHGPDLDEVYVQPKIYQDHDF